MGPRRWGLSGRQREGFGWNSSQCHFRCPRSVLHRGLPATRSLAHRLADRMSSARRLRRARAAAKGERRSSSIVREPARLHMRETSRSRFRFAKVDESCVCRNCPYRALYEHVIKPSCSITVSISLSIPGEPRASKIPTCHSEPKAKNLREAINPSGKPKRSILFGF